MARKPAGAVVDFSKEEGGGGRLKVPDGDYPFKIKAAKNDTSEKSGNPMIVVTFVGLEGKVKGKETRDYFPLVPKMLWKLRALLEAVGIDVPKKKIRVPFDKLIGKKVGLTLEREDDDEGSNWRSRPQDYIDFDELGEEPEDDDEDEDDDDDEADEEDLDEMDLDELKVVAKKLGIKSKGKSEKKLRKEIEAAREDEDDDDDDEVEDIDVDDDL